MAIKHLEPKGRRRPLSDGVADQGADAECEHNRGDVDCAPESPTAP
jgi:hypothetical protein